jgi:RecA/RadA recombinase
MTLFREKMSQSKSKGASEDAQFDVMYPTGFLALDHLNGTMIHVKTDDMKLDYKSIGIMDGSSNTFIGRSGCGKSTLVVQITGNIMRQYPESDAYIDDIEGSLPMSRKEFLLGLPIESIKTRVRFRDRDITTENVYESIKAIHDLKIANKAEYEYDTGTYDTYGNRIYKLIPTLYFIDSFAMLMPDDVANEDDIQNGMGATSTAKLNTQLVKKISQLLKGANIILFTVNHIMDDIQMGFVPKPLQVAGLKQGERLPGGRAAIYLANNLFRLDEKGTLKAEEGYGIAGTIVDVTTVKSRTNATRKSIPLIFNKSTGGFDKILSLYHFIKTEGGVSGAGKSMYFADFPECKFSQKSFKEDLEQDKDLQHAFAETAKKYLDTLLSETKNQEIETESFDINDAILSLG